MTEEHQRETIERFEERIESLERRLKYVGRVLDVVTTYLIEEGRPVSTQCPKCCGVGTVDWMLTHSCLTEGL